MQASNKSQQKQQQSHWPFESVASCLKTTADTLHPYNISQANEQATQEVRQSGFGLQSGF
jgi:hypothetical protein